MHPGLGATMADPDPFPGYNLRGLIVDYMLSRGWEFYPGDAYTDDSWLLPGRIQFEGNMATDRAIQWQIAQEEAK